MTNIKKIIIDNFQSHEHTEIEFGPGLNVIVGPSDYGKSAVVRALRWVLYNEPRGAVLSEPVPRSVRQLSN